MKQACRNLGMEKNFNLRKAFYLDMQEIRPNGRTLNIFENLKKVKDAH